MLDFHTAMAVLCQLTVTVKKKGIVIVGILPVVLLHPHSFK